MGNAFIDQGEIEKAIYHYRLTLRIAPNYASANFNLGILLFKQGQWHQASAPLRAVVAQQPERRHAWFTLARAYWQMGEADAAHTAIDAAVALDPANFDYWSEYAQVGVLFEQSGQVDKALVAYRRVLKFNPDAPVAKSGLENLLKKLVHRPH